MPLPTMLVAGVQKCGTGTMRTALGLHPQIMMTQRKELHFFDRHFDRGVDWYASQFTPRPRHRQFGEATPDYLYDNEARDRMAATLPTAKVVVILRDPVDRAYSQFWHTGRHGWEDKTFEEALELEPKRIASPDLEERARYSYVDRGHYIDQLLSLEAKHDRALIHVVLLDDLKADQAATLETLFAFLDVDLEPARTMPEQHRNRPRAVDPELGRKVLAEYPPMNPDTRAHLAEVFEESNRRLAEWLGRDLAGWTRA